MVQVAAALLFTLAAGLGVTVILAMLKSNENAILSALLGEGAFPIDVASQSRPAPQQSRPAPQRVTLRRSPTRHAGPHAGRTAIPMQPALSCAA